MKVLKTTDFRRFYEGEWLLVLPWLERSAQFQSVSTDRLIC